MSDTRQEFEDALANSPYKAPSVKSDGLYKSIVAEAMWWSWRTSRVAAEKRVAELSALLKAAKCPTCGGLNGIQLTGDECGPCQWCAERTRLAGGGDEAQRLLLSALDHRKTHDTASLRALGGVFYWNGNEEWCDLAFHSYRKDGEVWRIVEDGKEKA